MDQTSMKAPARYPLWQRLRDLGQMRRDPLGAIVAISQRGELTPLPVPNHAYLANTPTMAAALLVEQGASAERSAIDRSLLGTLLGDGLLLSREPKHRRQRKLMAPAFTPTHVQSYGTLMAEAAERLQAPWSEGTRLDLQSTMTALSLEIVAGALFGTEVSDEVGQVRDNVRFILAYLSRWIASVVPLPLAWPHHRRYHQAIRQLDSVVQRIITERRTYPQERSDLLSLLLHAQDEDDGTFMTDAELRDELMSILLAGHETTANALTWAWYLLMQHPEWYDRLCTEVEAVLAGRTPGVADLPQLPLAQRIFKETLRLYPPASLLNREVMKPLEVDGHALTPGMTIFVSLYVLHRRPESFPDPDTFHPDRFANDAEKAWPRMAYLPFALGTHLCIGSHFALLEGPLILATLAQHVRFSLAEEVPVRPIMEVTLRPSPFEVLVHRRQRRLG
jgi:cytochrome P450